MEWQAEGKRGSRPPAVRDNRHDSAYLFGAVCPQRRVGAAIIMPAVNSEAMAEHLEEISTQVTPGAHAVPLLDGAGWHQPGKRLPVPDNISLLPLPPYAPELNPVENVWEFLRGQPSQPPRLEQLRGDPRGMSQRLEQAYAHARADRFPHPAPVGQTGQRIGGGLLKK
jgi:DDE superfamily endonuclease